MSKSTAFQKRAPSFGRGGTFGVAERIIPDIRKIVENSPKIRDRTLSSTISAVRNRRGGSFAGRSNDSKSLGRAKKKAKNGN